MKELAQLLNAMQSAGVIQDYARILALLESGSVRREDIQRLAGRHGFADAWQRFEKRFLDE